MGDTSIIVRRLRDLKKKTQKHIETCEWGTMHIYSAKSIMLSMIQTMMHSIRN